MWLMLKTVTTNLEPCCTAAAKGTADGRPESNDVVTSAHKGAAVGYVLYWKKFA